MPEAPRWRTSSWSNGTNCVEVGQGSALVLVRDTKNRSAAGLNFPATTWTTFTSRLARPSRQR
ncbi:MAG: DUF397 domain-containing protein [Streptosporangiales bacterium]|nr:DUF397 domain-containing protein [Streptosporangiales bacterium]